VREKYCWLAGWRLLLEWCERKTLLAGAGAEQQNRVIVKFMVEELHDIMDKNNICNVCYCSWITVC